MTSSLSRVCILTASLTLAAGAAQAATVQRQVPAAPRGEVHISNIAGSILVRGWNRSTVAASAEMTDPRQRLVVEAHAGRTTVCVTNGATHCGWWSSSGRTHRAQLTVYVPEDSEVDVSAVSAGITSRGVAGVQHLRSVSGRIDATLLAGDNLVKSVTGNIELQGNRTSGRLRVATVSGELRLVNIAGTLEARTVNGTLDANIVSARAVRLHSTSGGITLHAQLLRGGIVKSDSVSGSQRLSVSAPAGYAYAAEAFSGHLENCFGQPVIHNHYGPGSRMDGTRGPGEGRVRIGSLSGNVSRCDH